MSLPSTSRALGLGFRAARRSAWLTAPALLVALFRAALTAAPFLLAAALLVRGFSVSASMSGGPGAILWRGLQAVLAPRRLALLVGLWASCALLRATFRAAYLSGALPVLGEELALSSPSPRFATGLAYDFVGIVPTALLGALLELAADLYALVALGAAALLALRHGGGHPVAAAALGGIALTSAVLARSLAGLVADAALARRALAGDTPWAALSEAALRVLARPAAFLAVGLVVGFASFLVLASASALGAASLGLSGGHSLPLVLGPRLLVAAASVCLAALLELWRLGALAALACPAQA